MFSLLNNFLILSIVISRLAWKQCNSWGMSYDMNGMMWLVDRTNSLLSIMQLMNI